MKNSGIILAAIALLFISMYVYSYSFEYFQKLKENRKLKKRLEKEISLNEQIALNDKAREEKYKDLSNRSKEIQEELKRLSDFRNELVERQNEKKINLKSIQHNQS